MAGKEENRIFVGGLSWETTERLLEDEFSRFGKVIEAQEMWTSWDARAVETSISEMHGRKLDGREISVNKAQPKASSDDTGYGYSGNRSSGGRGGYRGADGPPPVGRSDCFKCGKPGHWARECPSAGGDSGRVSSRSRFGGAGGGSGRGDRFGGSDRYGDRYVDDRYDGGRYDDRERFDSRDNRYAGGRDNYVSDRYGPPADRFGADRYVSAPPDRYPGNGYSKERSYEADLGPRGGGYERHGPARGGGGYDRDGPRGVASDRYGSGGPARYEGSYRDRPGPYDRPSRGGRPSYDDRY